MCRTADRHARLDPHIRPLTIDDEPFLWIALYNAVHVPLGEATPAPEIVREPWLARYVTEWMKQTGDLGFAAEINGSLVGAAWLRRWQQDDHGFGFVDEATPELSMSLLLGHRGRGIGTVLLHRLLVEAEQQFAGVSLSVSKWNPARRLYERSGFKVVGGPDGDSLTMEKRFLPRSTA